MRCPICHIEIRSGVGQCKVTDSRPKDDRTIRRRRECQCGYRFTTHETIIVDELEEIASTMLRGLQL